MRPQTRHDSDLGTTPQPPNLTLVQYSKRPEDGSSIASKEKPRRAGYGCLGRSSAFSNLSRRTLLRAGAAMQRGHPANECLFLTTTIPGSTSASFRAIAEWSGFAVQRLKAWIGKRVKENLSLYVWEWQRRGALHLHYVVHVENPDLRQYIQENLQAQWIRILDAISCNSGVDVYAKSAGFTHSANKSVVQCRAEVCKYSIAGYLAKYLGKGSNSTSVPSRLKFTPSRWYGVSRPLHALIRKYSRTTEQVFGRLRDALVAHEDCLSLLQSQSVKSYLYRHGCTQFRTLVAYFSEKETNSIWSTLTMENTAEQTSFNFNPSALQGLLATGLKMKNGRTAWQKCFSTFASLYVTTLESDWKNSRPMNPLDQEYLLDTLAYSLSYLRSAHMPLSGPEATWLKRAQDYVNQSLAHPPAPYPYNPEVTNRNKTVDRKPLIRQLSTRLNGKSG